MGIYFNPENTSFKNDSNSRIYIDKTGLLGELNKLINTTEKCISLSHARRFGKSQAAGMIDAYYSRGCDSHDLFAHYNVSKTAEYESHINKYNVIHIDMSSFDDAYQDNLITNLWRILYSELVEEYTDLMQIDNPISTVLLQVCKKSGTPFVIIIDEWDCVIRNHSERLELVHEYLQFLHSLFKSEESKQFLALGYITGILPLKIIDNESALNNFREYTMINSRQFTSYFGFTEDEVMELCKEYDMNFESVKQWYDGYLISGIHMYNPNSVYEAMVNHSLEGYWRNTSSYETINKYITLNYEGLKDDIVEVLKGNPIRVNVNKFRNDLTEINSKDDAITALIHLGYLGYNEERKQAYLPNYEVAEAFQLAIEDGNWSEIIKSISLSEDLIWATIDEDIDRVAQILEIAHDTYSSILKYNDENSLACAVTMAYYTAPAYYNVVRELPSGKGFADLAFIPRKDTVNKPAMVIELKWNQNSETAIRQIKDKSYDGVLQGYGEVLLVGISYDKDSKKHSCVIEKSVI